MKQRVVIKLDIKSVGTYTYVFHADNGKVTGALYYPKAFADPEELSENLGMYLDDVVNTFIGMGGFVSAINIERTTTLYSPNENREMVITSYNGSITNATLLGVEITGLLDSMNLDTAIKKLFDNGWRL
jgi:hypothetical protein